MNMCNMCLDIIKYCVGLFNECINRKSNLKEVFYKEKKKKAQSKFMYSYSLV